MSAQTFDTRIGRKFADLMAVEMQRMQDAVMNGSMTEREYAHQTGRFQGLREALDVYEEAEAVINGAERS